MALQPTTGGNGLDVRCVYEAQMLMRTTIQARTYVLATRVMVRHEEKARDTGMTTGESRLQRKPPPHTNKEGRRPDSRSRPRLARCARIWRMDTRGLT